MVTYDDVDNHDADDPEDPVDKDDPNDAVYEDDADDPDYKDDTDDLKMYDCITMRFMLLTPVHKAYYQCYL